MCSMWGGVHGRGLVWWGSVRGVGCAWRGEGGMCATADTTAYGQ